VLQFMGKAAQSRTNGRFAVQSTVGQLDLYIDLLDRQRPTTAQLSVSAIVG
jgi:hypothetical protein